MARPSAHAARSHSVWRVPLALAAMTLFGLLAALLGTGIWRAAAWLTLAVPVMVVVWCVWGGRRRARSLPGCG